MAILMIKHVFQERAGKRDIHEVPPGVEGYGRMAPAGSQRGIPKTVQGNLRPAAASTRRSLFRFE